MNITLALVLRFKASETLLGIETSYSALIYSSFVKGFKASETLLGIETFLKDDGNHV